jgi:hypothetical protein
MLETTVCSSQISLAATCCAVSNGPKLTPVLCVMRSPNGGVDMSGKLRKYSGTVIAITKLIIAILRHYHGQMLWSELLDDKG